MFINVASLNYVSTLNQIFAVPFNQQLCHFILSQFRFDITKGVERVCSVTVVIQSLNELSISFSLQICSGILLQPVYYIMQMINML